MSEQVDCMPYSPSTLAVSWAMLDLRLLWMTEARRSWCSLDTIGLCGLAKSETRLWKPAGQSLLGLGVFDVGHGWAVSRWGVDGIEMRSRGANGSYTRGAPQAGAGTQLHAETGVVVQGERTPLSAVARP
jgi:hypothetical protein